MIILGQILRYFVNQATDYQQPFQWKCFERNSPLLFNYLLTYLIYLLKVYYLPTKYILTD